jgi:hypothetical protein
MKEVVRTCNLVMTGEAPPPLS